MTKTRGYMPDPTGESKAWRRVDTVELPRIGDWMQTYSGRRFYPLDPRTEDIHPEDIAHALGMLCRYGGHVMKFYSVAEHCVHMSHCVSDENKLWALLHDATEAYVGDMVRPLKRSMPEYCDVENDLMHVIATRFRLDSWLMPDEVKEADNRILLNERAAVMRKTKEDWSLDGLEPLDIKIQAWSPEEAETEYLYRLRELTR